MQKRDKYDHIDIAGIRYGRLTALEKVGKSTWLFHCDCGNEVVLNYSRVLYGQKSCGCMRRDVSQNWVKSHMKHGKSKTKLYRKYRSMLSRCYNENDKGYARYGGRGISVCDEWKNDFQAFYDWAYSNGYDPTKDGRRWSIDRIDNSKGYSPSNCRFTTAKEQMRNRDITKTYEYQGSVYTASEFADSFGITDKSYVYRRVKKGQSLDEILHDWEKAHSIPNNLLDVSTYSKAHGVTPTTVNRWIKDGKVKAEKYGRKWYINVERR